MKPYVIQAIAALSVCFAAYASPTNAQSNSSADTENSASEQTKTRRIIKKIEPIPYWVDADQLRVRDNPVAGDVIGMLKLGEKVKAYDVFENWIRVSKPGGNEQWVNADFLTSNQVTWARFNNDTRRRNIGFSRATAANDVTLKRIKVKGEKDVRIYAASLKRTTNDNRVIVTRQNFRSGPYFEKRLVACGPDKSATHFQLMGEGYNYIMMEKDVRAQTIDVNSDQPRVAVTSGDVSPKSIAIADFSCKASDLK